jgi:hypothetical protein
MTLIRLMPSTEETLTIVSRLTSQDTASSKKRRLSRGKDKEPAPSKRATVAKKRAKPVVEDEVRMLQPHLPRPEIGRLTTTLHFSLFHEQDEIDNEQWDEVLADSDEEEEAEEEAFVEEDEDKDEAEQESSEEEEEEDAQKTGRGRRLSTRRSTAKCKSSTIVDLLSGVQCIV